MGKVIPFGSASKRGGLQSWLFHSPVHQQGLRQMLVRGLGLANEAALVGIPTDVSVLVEGVMKSYRITNQFSQDAVVRIYKMVPRRTMFATDFTPYCTTNAMDYTIQGFYNMIMSGTPAENPTWPHLVLPASASGSDSWNHYNAEWNPFMDGFWPRYFKMKLVRAVTLKPGDVFVYNVRCRPFYLNKAMLALGENEALTNPEPLLWPKWPWHLFGVHGTPVHNQSAIDYATDNKVNYDYGVTYGDYNVEIICSESDRVRPLISAQANSTRTRDTDEPYALKTNEPGARINLDQWHEQNPSETVGEM